MSHQITDQHSIASTQLLTQTGIPDLKIIKKERDITANKDNRNLIKKKTRKNMEAEDNDGKIDEKKTKEETRKKKCCKNS